MILVVGPGRCGSSAVARILHEEMGVFMGERFRPPDDENPQGFYEDLDFKELNDSHMRGKVTFPEFKARLFRLIGLRDENHNLWGVKDPRLCYFLGPYLSMAQNAVIVRCMRNHENIVASMVSIYGWTEDNSRRLLHEREMLVNNFIRNLGIETLCLDADQTITKEVIQNAGFSPNKSKSYDQARRFISVPRLPGDVANLH
jgi:hypothetical protein